MEGIFKTGRIAAGIGFDFVQFLRKNHDNKHILFFLLLKTNIKYDKMTFTKNNLKFISNLLKCESTYALIFITFNNIQIDNK